MTPFLIIGALVVLAALLFWADWFCTGATVVVVTFIGTVAYFTPPPDPTSVEERLNRGEAVLSSVAPDGTKLWRVQRGGRDVYYSTAGTHTTHEERVSKHSTRTVDDDVSNAR